MPGDVFENYAHEFARGVVYEHQEGAVGELSGAFGGFDEVGFGRPEWSADPASEADGVLSEREPDALHDGGKVTAGFEGGGVELG